jgi:NAD(P)H-nitrite reductase large subunit
MNDYLIVGNGIAGVRAAEILRAHDLTARIRIVCDEIGPAYSRVMLPHYLAGEIAEERLVLRDSSWYAGQRVGLVEGDGAVWLHPKERTLALRSGVTLSYDYLLVATGGAPAFPPIPGLRQEDGSLTCGVFGFRSRQDVQGLLNRASRQAVVIGAGPIGLLAAEALLSRGVATTVVEMLPQVVPQMLDVAAAGMVEAAARQHGCDVITGVRVDQVMTNGGQVTGVTLAGGQELPCQSLVVATGVLPNHRWLADSGVLIGRGIGVDEHMRTSLPGVYAAGDVCETMDCVMDRCVVNALWPGASEQGRVAATNMLGLKATYAGSLAMNSATFFGVRCIGIGLAAGERQLVDDRRHQGIYRQAFFSGDRLVGVVLVGEVDSAGVYLSVIRQRAPVRLSTGEFWSLDYAGAMRLGSEDRLLVIGSVR